MNRLSVSELFGEQTTNKRITVDEEYIQETKDGSDLNLEAIVRDVLDSGARVAPDLRINDKNFKEFPNFYEWCFSKEGGNQVPFAKQLAFATHLFAEWCPLCSSKAFRDISKIPVDYPAKEFPEKVVFLEHGKCPKCGARRSELVANGDLNFYQELALCAGQRCVTGDTLVQTSKGLYYIDKLIKSEEPFSVPTSNVDRKVLSKITVPKGENLIRVTFDNGHYITGTKEHPVYLRSSNYIEEPIKEDDENFIKLGSLLKLNYTKLGAKFVPQDIWGTSSKPYNVLRDYADYFKSYLTKGYIRIPSYMLSLDKNSWHFIFKNLFNTFIGDLSGSIKVVSHKLANDLRIILLNLGYTSSYDPESQNLTIEDCSNFSYIKSVEIVEPEETYDIHVDIDHQFYASGILNHNSGKSAFFQLAIPYLAHKWLMINKPVETLGLLKDSILIGSFGALTFEKARELLWQPISNAIENSIWFQQYFQMLDDAGEKAGIELYKFKDTFLSFNHKNLIFAPVGPSKRKLRGSTRICCVLDEIGWFPYGEDNEQKEMANANEVYVALDRSLKTVRNACERLLREGYDNIPHGYMAGISSPSSYNDKIMSLIRAHEGSTEVLTGQFPTWEMNPMFTKKDFAKEYRDDPVKAERDFGANPPMAENPWISDVGILNNLFVEPYGVKYRYHYAINKAGHNTVYAKLENVKAPSSCPPTVLSIDGGYSNNSFACTVVTPTPEGARLLAVVEVAPKKGDNVINYNRITEHIIKPLIDYFNVKLVCADRWNSIKILQDLENDKGVFTDTYSLKPIDFEYIRDYLYDDVPLITMPKLEHGVDYVFTSNLDEYPHCFKYTPISHLYHQFSSVNLNYRGSVEKGTGFTDDILRALCLGISYCLNDEDIKRFGLDGNANQTIVYGIGSRVAGSTSSNIGVKSSNSSSFTIGSKG